MIIATPLISCSGKNKKPVIKFSADSASIVIKNIDEASLLQVKNQYQGNADSVELISVLLKPGELDSLQDDIVVPGKVIVTGDSVVFVPEQPFQKNKSYRVENYIGIKFAGLSNLLNGTARHNLQPQKQILKR
ncbi:hypothetical protein GJU39_12445 [Pedobacter petrophilus]|uniref:Uncharacterized protein n=1 Tax=Pedobacter petrophilus TaxID=1908241 RepID=A0A7K0FZ77_9SPHI|nr:hypothetical protein [Pedobacter petrophilus]MRX76897.1 hypothetical protein [Pedobacter petrophilus]